MLEKKEKVPSSNTLIMQKLTIKVETTNQVFCTACFRNGKFIGYKEYASTTSLNAKFKRCSQHP